MTANVVGLDLSLTSTGIATTGHTAPLRPKKLKSIDRMRWIVGAVGDYLAAAGLSPGSVVAVEGPSFGTPGQVGQHERGGLWWHVLEAVDRVGYRIAVVPPSVLKKTATGKGNASKDEVLVATLRRFDWFAGGNDEADALWLAVIAAKLIGEAVIDLPASHQVDLAAKVQWLREPVAA